MEEKHFFISPHPMATLILKSLCIGYILSFIALLIIVSLEGKEIPIWLYFLLPLMDWKPLLGLSGLILLIILALRERSHKL